jgi:hypothetical protein
MMKVVQPLNVGPKNLWTKKPECEGLRLKRRLFFKINEKNIAELCDMDILDVTLV